MEGEEEAKQELESQPRMDPVMAVHQRDLKMAANHIDPGAAADYIDQVMAVHHRDLEMAAKHRDQHCHSAHHI